MKPAEGITPAEIIRSLPTRERELKHAIANGGLSAARSLPTRERELKLRRGYHPGGDYPSLPTRERELKQLLGACLHGHIGRSLHGSVN